MRVVDFLVVVVPEVVGRVIRSVDPVARLREEELIAPAGWWLLVAGGYPWRSRKSGPLCLANQASSLVAVGVRSWVNPVGGGGQEGRVQVRLSSSSTAL
ncbi:hypothetical protein BKA56DRAFT_593227 [Ilyonectria sp. MPI-CAGE-AT-0026]|nr:hypothetical protein BKA56DRAFT_593227 [Ilyonectria sp. MPI-CAGE-AT-0026]